LLAAAARGELGDVEIARGAGAAVGVALVDEAYPGPSRGGGVIEGLDALEAAPDLHVFHAATTRVGDAWAIRGGRAVHVDARAATAAAARTRVYAAIATLGGHGWRCRHDIGDGAPMSTLGAPSGGGPWS